MSNHKLLHLHPFSAIHHCQFIRAAEQTGRRRRMRLSSDCRVGALALEVCHHNFTQDAFWLFFKLPGDLLQPPPGSAGAMLVVEGVLLPGCVL